MVTICDVSILYDSDNSSGCLIRTYCSVMVTIPHSSTITHCSNNTAGILGSCYISHYCTTNNCCISAKLRSNTASVCIERILYSSFDQYIFDDCTVSSSDLSCLTKQASIYSIHALNTIEVSIVNPAEGCFVCSDRRESVFTQINICNLLIVSGSKSLVHQRIVYHIRHTVQIICCCNLIRIRTGSASAEGDLLCSHDRCCLCLTNQSSVFVRFYIDII